jgi:pSer/pThr/pTyr-binding forkhead associated (FHA) protein
VQLSPTELQAFAILLSELRALDCLATCLCALAVHTGDADVSPRELVAAGVPSGKAEVLALAIAKVRAEPTQRRREPAALASVVSRVATLAFPIAHAMAFGRSLAESATSRFWNVQLAYEQLMRVTTLVLLADLRSRSRQLDPKARHTLAKKVRRLRAPCRGDWYDAMHGIALVHRVAAPDSPIKELAAAAVSFSKVQASEAPDVQRKGQLNEALLWLRNVHFAHAGTRRDMDSEHLLPVATQWVAQVLRHFEEGFASFRLAGQHDEGAKWLHGPDASRFAEAPDLPVQAHAGSVWVVPTDPNAAPFELAPLVEALESHDPIGCHDGFTQKRRVLLGVGTRAFRDDVGRLDAFLSEFNLDLRLGRDDLTSWGLTEWAEDMTRSTVDALRRIKYFPEAYVERPTYGSKMDERGAEDTTLRFLQQGKRSALLIEADAGAGKTSLFCWLAEHLLGQPADETHSARPCVVLVLGESMRRASESQTPVFDSIGAALHFQTSGAGAVESFPILLDAFRASLERDDDPDERPLILLVDAINESHDPGAVLDELAGMAAAARAAWERAGNKRWVRIIASVRRGTLARLDRSSPNSRPVHRVGEFESFIDAEGREQPWLSLRPFSDDEVSRAYDLARACMAAGDSGRRGCALAFDELPEHWRKLLRHPLHVPLFHEAFEGLPGQELHDADEYILWRIWIDRVLVLGHARSVYDTALKLANAALEAGTYGIPAEAIDQARESFWAECGGSLARVAGARSPVETLEELGVLRRPTAAGPLTFRNDTIAECLAEDALCRRAGVRGREAGSLTEDDLTVWWELPASRWMEGAVARAAARWFDGGRPEVLSWLADSRVARGGHASHALVERALRHVVPSWAGDEETARFEAALRRGLRDARQRDGRDVVALSGALSTIVRESLDKTASLALARCWATLMRDAVACDPENDSLLRQASRACREVGKMLHHEDPVEPLRWLESSRALAETLVKRDPDSYANTIHLFNAYIATGFELMISDPNGSRRWHEMSLKLAEELSSRDPGNTQYSDTVRIAKMHLRGNPFPRYAPDPPEETVHGVKPIGASVPRVTKAGTLRTLDTPSKPGMAASHDVSKQRVSSSGTREEPNTPASVSPSSSRPPATTETRSERVEGRSDAPGLARQVERALESLELDKARRIAAAAVALGRATPAVRRFYLSKRPVATTLPDEGWHIRKEDWPELIAFGVAPPPLALFDVLGTLVTIGEIPVGGAEDKGVKAEHASEATRPVARITLVVHEVGRPVRRASFSQGAIEVGTRPSSHLCLRSPQVSRMHALLEVSDQGGAIVMDLGSASGTFLNGKRVSKQRLRSGDELWFGDVRVQVQLDAKATDGLPGALPVPLDWTKGVRRLSDALGVPTPRLVVGQNMTRAARLTSVRPAQVELARDVVDQARWEALRPDIDLCLARLHVGVAGSSILRRPDDLQSALCGLAPLFDSRAPLPPTGSAQEVLRLARRTLSPETITSLRPQFLSLPSGNAFNGLALNWLTACDLTVAHAALILCDDIVPVLSALPHHCLGATSGETWDELVWALADHFMSDDYEQVREALGLGLSAR